jgi:branched-chain amino acid transport system substrate-binding protein
MKQRFLLSVLAALALLVIGACRSEPVEITVVETVEVEVEKIVEKEVTVVETVEVEVEVEKIVEKEVTVVETVEVQVEPGEQEYTLGVVLPFTGPLGSFGAAFRDGIELAVEQMNEELGQTNSMVRFSVVSADTEGSPDGAAKAFQTVVQTSGAQVVVGPLSTSEVLGAKQFADENQITIVAPASSGVAAAIPDDFIFRVMNPPDTFASQAFAKIAEARGYETVVILQLDDPFGNGLADAFSALFTGEVSVVKYAPEPTDLSSEVSKLSAEVAGASGSTAVFCICFLGDAQKALQVALVDPTLRSVDWMGVENLRSPEILADAGQAEFLAEVNFTSLSFSASENPNTQPFIEAYAAKYGDEPGPFTNYAYDAANIAMLSMLMAGNDGAAVREVVPFVANHYIGTQVQTYLDQNGDQSIANFSIYQLAEDGSDFVEIGTFEGASGSVTLNE